MPNRKGKKLVRAGLPRPGDLLYRIIESPDLIGTLQTLSPSAIGEIIRTVGIEDAGEIAALATTEQLVHLFDEDLWRADQPGVDETFDPDRFVLWLEVMLEAGERFTAKRLAELPEDLILLAFSQHILVLNIDDLAAQMPQGPGEADLLDKALESVLSCELDAYQVVSRRPNGWDAVLTALVALDEDHSHLCQRILARCCHASWEIIEENGGLYQVLTSEEMLASDAAADREDRRAARGHIAPSQAAVSVCGLGLAHLVAHPPQSAPAAPTESRVLSDQSAVKAFRVGFHLLCRETPPSAARSTGLRLTREQLRRARSLQL